jgi:hypothetical protein
MWKYASCMLLLVTTASLVTSPCYGRLLQEVYDEPGLCFKRNFEFIANGGVFLLVEDVIACLEKVTIETSIAKEAVSGYNALFSTGYGYYNYNNDILDSSPIKNPYNWTIFNGTDGGRVNFAKEFEALRAKIDQNGANGMLLYQIQNILTKAKDAHTSGIGNNFDELILVSKGNSSDRWLSLLKDEDTGDVHVVGYDAKEENSPAYRLRSINEEEPLGFLKDLTANPAMGSASSFKSPGTRMTSFLNGMVTVPGQSRYCCAGSLGDISTLPASLNLEFEDGVKDEWIFMVYVGKEYLTMPIGELINVYNTPVAADSGESLYTTFQSMKSNTARRKVPSKASVSDREYDIEIGNPQSNILQFSIFSERDPQKPDIGTPLPLFSAYTIVNDTMVWKLTTFTYPNNNDDLINFWNDMVSVAQEKDISTLIIDISGNGGGAVTNVGTCIQLLFPQAALEDVIASQSTRISDIMLKMGNDVQPMFEEFLDVLVDNINLVEDKLDAIDVAQIIYIFENGYELSTGVNPTFKPFQDNWLTVDSVQFDKLHDLLLPEDNDTNSSPEDILKALKDSVRRPSYCINTTCSTLLRNEGGVETKISDFFKSSAYPKQAYDRTKKYAIRTPFSKYILLSDGVAGSASDRMVSTLRYLSDKYKDPSVITVGYGGTGQQDEFAMTQFSGGISQGGSILGNMYGIYTCYRVLGGILTQIQKVGLAKELGLSQKDISAYQASVKGVLDALPVPPIFSKTLPQYVWAPVYNQNIPPNQTIPQEFWSIPPAKYMPIWPRPGGTTLFDQTSLQEIYENAIKVSV